MYFGQTEYVPTANEPVTCHAGLCWSGGGIDLLEVSKWIEDKTFNSRTAVTGGALAVSTSVKIMFFESFVIEFKRLVYLQSTVTMRLRKSGFGGVFLLFRVKGVNEILYLWISIISAKKHFSFKDAKWLTCGCENPPPNKFRHSGSHPGISNPRGYCWGILFC